MRSKTGGALAPIAHSGERLALLFPAFLPSLPPRERELECCSLSRLGRWGRARTARPVQACRWWVVDDEARARVWRSLAQRRPSAVMGDGR